MELYKDSAAEIKERVSDLIGRMTIEEKLGQMIQLPAKQGLIEENYIDKMDEWHIGSFLHCSGETIRQIQKKAAGSRLGIPVIFGVDAIHGHCFHDKGTVFPTQLALACSWNPELIKSAAQVTAREVRGSGLHWTFSPVLCIARDPRWGRIDETFGEDPWLISELGAAMIRGYQGDDINNKEKIAACAKHFIAYGETTGGRDSYESEVSERKLRSIFLPPFQRAVEDESVATVMAAYQAIDGEPVSASSRLLRSLLRDELGFPGVVISDWDNLGNLVRLQKVVKDSTEAAEVAVSAGNDIIMSTPSFFEDAVELKRLGRLDEKLIDESVERILELKFRLGLFDDMRFYEAENPESVIGCTEHWDVSLEASRQSLTLLTNKGILPLRDLSGKKILLTGPNADDIHAQLGDWSFGSMQAGTLDCSFHREDSITIIEALREAAKSGNFTVRYIRGADCTDDEFDEISEAVAAAEDADLIIYCAGDTLELHGEGRDRSDLSLSGKQNELFKAMKKTGKPVVSVFLASKPLTIRELADGSDALLCAFNPGALGGKAIVEVLLGEFNPVGRLPISFPYSVGQLPVFYNKYSGWHTAQESERYVDAPEGPLFAFGEGLSYTTFTYSNLKVLTPRIGQGEEPRFSIDIENTGSQTGIETVQLYIRDVIASVTTAVKSLKGFKKVELAAGEKKKIELSISCKDLFLVNKDLIRVAEPGEFQVLIGHSARDCDLLSGMFILDAE